MAVIDQAIISLKLEEEEKTAQAAARGLGLTYVNLVGYPIATEVVNTISQEEAVLYHLVVYLKTPSEVRLATHFPPSDRLNRFLSQLAAKTKATVRLAYCSQMSYSYVLNLYLRYKQEAKQKQQKLAHEKGEDYAAAVKDIGDVASQIKKVSTTALLDLLFAGAVINRSSDIHIEPTVQDARLRFRVDGILQDVANLTKEQYRALLSRIKNLAHLKLDIGREPQDGRFEVKSVSHQVDVRVSTLPATFGEDIVLRLLLEDAVFLNIDELGFNPSVLALIKEAMREPHGMILNTGPTGSGKTTTLYAVLAQLNHPEVKIITIEDPVEYRLTGINQIQVDPASRLTFASALRGALRQDPDIIMVGEVRDSETAKIGLQAALTGHLVLSTLHANSAPAALPRLLEMGIEPYLLAGSINLIIAQRLVRRICPVCKGKGGDCPNCRGSGYQGRVPIVEALKPTQEFNRLIAQKASIAEFEQKAKDLGMETMLEDGLSKVAAGLTTRQEVERVSQENV